MKNVLKFSAVAAVAAAAFIFASCDKNNNGPVPDPAWVIITFDAMPANQLAGPTSYGENLYSSFVATDGYEQFTSCDYADFLTFGVNEIWDSCDFWNGGVAVSNWNIMSNPAGVGGNWWQTYENQCSVYNKMSKDGSNTGAGFSGSNFAVVTGSQSDFSDNGQLTLSDGLNHYFDHLFVCNTAYAYGVIVNGDSFSDNGPLSEQQGYFELVVYGYEAGAEEPSASDRILLADYRGGNSTVIDRWTPFDLVNIKRHPVNRLVFEFEGSDMHPEYGLNTPKYVCIDDICISEF